MTTSRKGWSEEERAYLAAIIESEGGGLVDYRDQVPPSGSAIHSRQIEPQERTWDLADIVAQLRILRGRRCPGRHRTV